MTAKRESHEFWSWTGMVQRTPMQSGPVSAIGSWKDR
jgi:hypothetical protein